MASITHPVVTLETPAAAEFKPGEPFVGLYLMHFRHPQMGNHVLTKNFRFNGSLREARERAEKHCQVLGLKMMFVEPLICDLKKDEDQHLGVTIQSNLEVAKEEVKK